LQEALHEKAPPKAAERRRPSWTEIDRSDHDCAVALEAPCQDLVGCDPFDLLTVLLKEALQIGWTEGLEGSSPLFKCPAGDGASDASVPVASGKPDGLGKVRPKEAIFKLNRTGHFVPTASGFARKAARARAAFYPDAWLSCAGSGELAPEVKFWAE
jgi:hypothetical protein